MTKHRLPAIPGWILRKLGTAATAGAVRTLFSLVLSHVRAGISAGWTVTQVRERLDVSQFTDRYVGTDRAVDAFARYFLDPAVTIAFREGKTRNE